MARVLKKADERMYKILVKGHRHDGKTELACRWVLDGEQGYIVPIDNREIEYLERRPDVVWQVADVDMSKGEHRDATKIDEAIAQDLKSGLFARNNIGVAALDSITPIFDQHARNKDNAGKANAMANLFGAGNRVPCDVLYFIHLRKAGADQFGNNMVERDSLSDLEIIRAGQYIDLIIEMVRKKRNKKTGEGAGDFGVKIVWCRELPAWSGVTIWDNEGNFKGMRQKIKAAIAKARKGGQKPSENGDRKKVQPRQFSDFLGGKYAFPNINTAISMGMQYFEEYDGKKFYAFGDPAETPVKKDGEEGVNGAANYARNSYNAIKAGKKIEEGYAQPKTAEQMASTWARYVIAKVKAEIERYKEEGNEEEGPQPFLMEEEEPEREAHYSIDF